MSERRSVPAGTQAPRAGPRRPAGLELGLPGAGKILA